MLRTANGLVKHISNSGASSLTLCPKCKTYFNGDKCPNCEVCEQELSDEQDDSGSDSEPN